MVPEAVAVKRRQRQSSSEEAARERQDLRQGFAMGIRERRPDAASVVLAAGTAQAREEQRLHQKRKAPPDMKTGQSAMTCLRREVPTDHEARSHTPAAAREPRLSGSAGLQPGSRTKVNTKHDRIHTQALGESGPKMDGDASVTNQTELWRQRPSTRAARGGEREWCWETTRPRAAREGACGEHVGQHVNERTAR